jgi:Uma2 family endonuclease
MAPETRPPPPWPRPAERIPALENGDRLTREEFERRYDAMPHLKKAELIEGVVHMPSPVSRSHSRPLSKLVTCLCYYSAATPGTEEGDNGSVLLDLDNEPQPDAYLRIDPACGGQSRTSEDDYVEGPPELVAEVARSSASYDLHAKLHVYRRNGVREYVVWRTLDEAIDWYVLEGGEYRRLDPDPSGLLKSRVFPGLWLDAAALLRGDLARVLAALGEGIASAEHVGFVKRLADSRPSGGPPEK